MNEKIIAKGKFTPPYQFALICFAIAGIVLIVCFAVAASFGNDAGWAFRGIEYGYYWFFIGAALFMLLGIWILTMKFELIITEDKVTGKTMFGKRVDLPISQISTTGTGMFHRVSIATSSGAISFYGVINQNEIFSALSDLLVKRQNDTKVTTVKAQESTSGELKKFKELLDQGVITQEEFDAKKKQLLGL